MAGKHQLLSNLIVSPETNKGLFATKIFFPKGIATALIDTGSELNFINEKTAKRLALNISRCNSIQIRNASGNHLKAASSQCCSEFIIQATPSKAVFDVVTIAFDCIIGKSGLQTT